MIEKNIHIVYDMIDSGESTEKIVNKIIELFGKENISKVREIINRRSIRGES